MYQRLILMACLGLTACVIQEKDVAGNWQAVAFFENGKSVVSELDSVSLKLTPDGGYEFRSQGFYRESGSYRISARYLFLTDTMHDPDKEHIVKVLYVSPDTLKIRMSQNNKERVLFLTRQK